MHHAQRRPAVVGGHLLLSLIVALAALTLTPASPAMAGGDRDCGDFNTQAAAQEFFLNHGGPNSDPHQLDADGDGIACESNPCPCSNDQGGGDGGGDAPQPDPEPKQVKQRAKILKVIDGDTVDAKIIKGRKVRVRLIGIDTPEVYGGVECGGKAASRTLKRKLPRGTRVLLVSDPSQDLKDRYDRLLRYVMKGKKDINRSQVRSGRAEVYVYDNDPFRRVKSYRAAQRHAKDKNLGIWKNCK